MRDPKKIPVEFVNLIAHTNRTFHGLHSVAGDGGISMLDECRSTNKRKIVRFPGSESLLNLFHNLIKMILSNSTMEQRDAKI